MQTCPDCHAQVEDLVKYCENCGYCLIPDNDASLSPSEEPTSPSLGAKLLSARPSDPSSTPQGTCSACGFQNLPGEMFCLNCGVQLAPIVSTPPPPPTPIPSPSSETKAAEEGEAGRIPLICSFCGYQNEANEVFCMNCGLQLTSTPAPVEEGPVQLSSMDVQYDMGAPVFPQEDSISSTEFQIPLGAPEISDQPQISRKLIVEETGSEINIPVGKSEILIGRSDPVRNVYPDIDMTPYGGELNGVSRMHARLILKDINIFIEDLNSTNFTFLNREKLQPGQQYQIHHGDTIRLGLLRLEYLSN